MIPTHKPEEFDITDFVNGFLKVVAKAFTVAIIFIFGVVYGYYKLGDDYKSKPKICRFKVRIDNRPELNQESVYQQILDYEILEPEIVLRQSILETGWYTSKNCLERNNCFGMKGGDKTNDNPNGYAIYSDWRESVLAYKLWQDRNYNPEYCGTYYDFLKHIGYATSPEYVEKLKGIKL